VTQTCNTLACTAAQKFCRPRCSSSATSRTKGGGHRGTAAEGGPAPGPPPSWLPHLLDTPTIAMF
jgi:hypothetical protein